MRVDVLNKQYGRTPNLAVILVGDDPGSVSYVTGKAKAATEVGIRNTTIRREATIAESELLELVEQLNNDDDVDGILVQLPLPKHIDENKVILAISPEKDVDAFHPYNVGKIMIGNYSFLPCTPAGIMVLLERSGIAIEGKKCVVVGRSNIVGKPMAMLLLHANGTVMICHSRTKNLAEICREADILVAAIGKAEFFGADMVKEGAVVIDVGMNRNAEGKLVGDVDFAAVEPIASYITPVPGGVGPMTIAMLMKNCVESVELQK